MNGNRREKNWVGDDSPEAEAALRETLLRLKASGANNREICKNVLASPFILALVWAETARNRPAKRRHYRSGAESREARPAGTRRGHPRLPAPWEDCLARDPELRGEWRSETVYLLGRACERNGMLGCDLERSSIGAYWRTIIAFKAMKAAWKLWIKSRFWMQHSQSLADQMSEVPDRKATDGTKDLRLDLSVAIEELQHPRQRAVMRLAATGYDYREIAAMEGISYDMVRYAVDKAKEVLRMRLGPGA